MPEEGCALCEATWGNYWAEIDGQKMFFCCDICATEFRNMVNIVKEKTGWKTIDEIVMNGNHRGRQCTAMSSGKIYHFFMKFDSTGAIQTFAERNGKGS